MRYNKRAKNIQKITGWSLKKCLKAVVDHNTSSREFCEENILYGAVKLTASDAWLICQCPDQLPEPLKAKFKAEIAKQEVIERRRRATAGRYGRATAEHHGSPSAISMLPFMFGLAKESDE